MTKQIELTKGQVALVDDEWYEYLSRWSWKAQWNKCTNSFYATRSSGTRINSITILMHREIMKTPKGMLCDHINHNTLDNQTRNLRNLTSSQNQMNRKGAQSNNKLGEKGIYMMGSQYRVRVKVNKVSVFEKNFNTLDEAIVARNEATDKYHGKFAKRNNA